MYLVIASQNLGNSKPVKTASPGSEPERQPLLLPARNPNLESAPAPFQSYVFIVVFIEKNQAYHLSNRRQVMYAQYLFDLGNLLSLLLIGYRIGTILL